MLYFLNLQVIIMIIQFEICIPENIFPAQNKLDNPLIGCTQMLNVTINLLAQFSWDLLKHLYSVLFLWQPSHSSEKYKATYQLRKGGGQVFFKISIMAKITIALIMCPALKQRIPLCYLLLTIILFTRTHLKAFQQ